MTGNAIYQLLKGVNANGYPGYIPQGKTFPAWMYQIIDTGPNNYKAGVSISEVKRLQISIFDEHLADCAVIAASFRGILEGYSGTKESIKFKDIKFHDEHDNYDPKENKFQWIQEYMLHINTG